MQIIRHQGVYSINSLSELSPHYLEGDNTRIHKISPSFVWIVISLLFVFQVPTLHDLTEELAAWKGEGNLHNYKKTSLRPYIETFEKFLETLPQNTATADPNTDKVATRPSEQLKMAVESIWFIIWTFGALLIAYEYVNISKHILGLFQCSSKFEIEILLLLTWLLVYSMVTFLGICASSGCFSMSYNRKTSTRNDTNVIINVIMCLVSCWGE